MVSCTPRPLYPRVMDRRLDGPQSRSGRCGVEKNLVPAGNRNPVFQPVAHRYTDWAIPAPNTLSGVYLSEEKYHNFKIGLSPYVSENCIVSVSSCCRYMRLSGNISRKTVIRIELRANRSAGPHIS
jgi:hypothetical protein